MSLEILTRIIWSLGIIVAGLVVFVLVNKVVLARAARQNQVTSNPLDGKSTILYFTTPDCAPCRTIQRPALKNIRAQFGDRVEVIEVDATRQPKLAKDWGVLSVPTTFIIDRRGNPIFVNHGVARAEKLRDQIQHIER
jgi:thiol-disulfide isomerase/thioredoxin